jgi:membrane associated rhomboid family serine protease
VVRGLLIAVVVTFLLSFFAPASVVWMLYSVSGTSGMDWLLRPWSWFTYPFLVMDPLNVLFQGFWLYIVGGMLERSWGSRNFAALFFIFSAIAALAFVPAFYLLRAPVVLAGLTLPLSALTVAWAALDPEMEILFWGVLPLKAKMLALLDVLLVYFYFGFGYGPVVALFTLAGPAAAWYYVRKMPRLALGFRPSRPRPRRLLREEPSSRERAPGINPLRNRQEQEEIARLRKLLGEDDDGRTTTRH